MWELELSYMIISGIVLDLHIAQMMQMLPNQELSLWGLTYESDVRVPPSTNQTCTGFRNPFG